MGRKMAVSVLVSLLASSAHANARAAIACELDLVRHGHESLVFCKDQIDPVSESRYQQMVQDFSIFISANPPSRPPSVPLETVEQIQTTLSQMGWDQVCRGSDYPELRRIFFHYVSDEGVEAVRKLLSVPKDPYEGDCF